MYWDDDFALDEYARKGWSIWPELRDFVGMWEDTYREYWGLSGSDTGDRLTDEELRTAKNQHGMAGTILKMIQSLTVAGAADPEAEVHLTESDLKWVRKILRAHKESPVVTDWIGLQLALAFTSQIDGATDRGFRLLGLMQGQRFTDRASSYLARVSTLYVQGLELETGVMCRAALEAALLDRLEEYFDTDKEPPSLDKLLRIAGENEVLDGYQATRSRRGWRARTGTALHRADRIRRMGNFIMHEFLRFPDDKGEIQNAFEATRELTLVLSDLFPPPTFT